MTFSVKHETRIRTLETKNKEQEKMLYTSKGLFELLTLMDTAFEMELTVDYLDMPL